MLLGDELVELTWESDQPRPLHMGTIRDVLPEIDQIRVACPVQNCDLAHVERSSTLFWMIVDLNDSHGWSRERIADWVDSLDVDLSFPVPED